MSRVHLPDVGDLAGVVADYLDALVPESEFDGQRQPIIQRCVPAFEQLMQLIESVNATGQVDEILLKAFMRDLALAGVRLADEDDFGGPDRAGLAIH